MYKPVLCEFLKSSANKNLFLFQTSLPLHSVVHSIKSQFYDFDSLLQSSLRARAQCNLWTFFAKITHLKNGECLTQRRFQFAFRDVTCIALCKRFSLEILPDETLPNFPSPALNLQKSRQNSKVCLQLKSDLPAFHEIFVWNLSWWNLSKTFRIFPLV